MSSPTASHVSKPYRSYAVGSSLLAHERHRSYLLQAATRLTNNIWLDRQIFPQILQASVITLLAKSALYPTDRRLCRTSYSPTRQNAVPPIHKSINLGKHTCRVLRFEKDSCPLKQGTRPSKKLTNIPYVKKDTST